MVENSLASVDLKNQNLTRDLGLTELVGDPILANSVRFWKKNVQWATSWSAVILHFGLFPLPRQEKQPKVLEKISGDQNKNK